MPTNERVTREQVFEVADDLNRQGIEPSARKLIEEIGHGSLTTHQKHLNAWRDAQAMQKATLPNYVTEISSDNALQFCVAIQQCWQEGYQAGRDSASDEIEILKASFDDVRSELHQLKQASHDSKKPASTTAQSRSKSAKSGQAILL